MTRPVSSVPVSRFLASSVPVSSVLVPSLLALAAFTLLPALHAIAQQAPQPNAQQAPQPNASPAGFFVRYEARAEATEVNQPHWATPLITINPRIEQGFRTDFIRQTAPGDTTWNYGGTKGLQIIPFARAELRISPPPFFTHSDPQVIDGFGDIAFRLKYRLYGSNEEHHSAIISAEFAASLPTGKNGNGSCCAILTPTVELGKGFGHLDLLTALGATLPASNTARLGRSIAWNNALQYHATKLLWIEDEFNSTFYFGGKNDGKQQTFNTPGIVIGRIPLTRGRRGVPSPDAVTFAAGEQIALTHFSTYNHSPVFSARLRF